MSSAASEVSFIQVEFDFDDGFAEYKVEWNVGRTEYEYEISAVDGAILEHTVDNFGVIPKNKGGYR